jgi:hypothetical protein
MQCNSIPQGKAQLYGKQNSPMSEDNNNNNTVRPLPLWRRTLEAMVERGEIKYGAHFLWPVLEKEWRSTHDKWAFREEFIGLCYELKSMGFMVSERGMHGEGWRIMLREEMADHVKSIEYRKAHHTLHNSLSLASVDKGGMSVENSDRIDFWQKKTAFLGAQMLHLLRQRGLPQSPDMKEKSIKQIANGQP